MDATLAAYIAGFLDGDGSIHLQIIKQREYRYGFYVRVSVSFHQHTSGRAGLEWLHGQLKVGYLRNRAGQMSDYIITPRIAIRKLLVAIAPYVIFKRKQVKYALEIMDEIEKTNSSESFLAVTKKVDAFSSLNRSKRRKNTMTTVVNAWKEMGRHTPVTTDPARVR